MPSDSPHALPPSDLPSGSGTPPEETLRIGKIIGCHGVQGELLVRPNNADCPWVSTLKHLILELPVKKKKGAESSEAKSDLEPTEPQTEEQWEFQILKVLNIRFKGPSLLIRVEKIKDRNLAEKLIHQPIYGYKTELPPPEPGAYLIDDLIGLQVIDITTQDPRGTVLDVVSSGDTDYLEILHDPAYQPVMIPFQDAFFPEVSLEKKAVYLDKLTDLRELSTPLAASEKKKSKSENRKKARQAHQNQKKKPENLS
ncbi:MAG: ribosome maturation factor RimM [Cyanobacteria bacterium]|nr:ribosome maturation factor RimM [Cyanobacteriota bacterium]